jgi:hypothetical protein
MYFIANDLGNRRTFWANGIFYASVRGHPSTIAELLAEPKSGKAPKPLCSLDWRVAAAMLEFSAKPTDIKKRPRPA